MPNYFGKFIPPACFTIFTKLNLARIEAKYFPWKGIGLIHAYFLCLLKVRKFKKQIIFVSILLKNEQKSSILIAWYTRICFWDLLTFSNGAYFMEIFLCGANNGQIFNVQLNKYETVPYFFLLNQNLTWDCLLISVFLPEFAWSEPKIVLFWCSEQF